MRWLIALSIVVGASAAAQPRAEFVVDGSVRQSAHHEFKPVGPARTLHDRPVSDTAATRPLIRAAQELLEQPNTLAVLLLDHSSVVLERYKPPATSGSWLQGFSMTKSVVAYALGSGLCEGRIADLTAPAVRHAPALEATVFGNASVHDLLTMRSGGRPVDPSGQARPNEYVDILTGRTTLRQAMRDSAAAVHAPGKVFNYFNHDTQALQEILSAVYGSPTEGFARSLWAKMEAESPARWQVDRENNLFAWAGLAMTLRDWGRLGLHLAALHRGLHGDCMRDFMVQATTRQVEPAERMRVLGFRGYGFQTWTDPAIGGAGSFWLVGAGGQHVAVDPASMRVMVVIGFDPSNARRQDAVLRLFDAFRKL